MQKNQSTKRRARAHPTGPLLHGPVFYLEDTMNIKSLFLSSALLLSFPYSELTAHVPIDDCVKAQSVAGFAHSGSKDMCDVDLCKEYQHSLLHFLSEDRDQILSLKRLYQQEENPVIAFQLGHLYDTRSWKSQQVFNAIHNPLDEEAQALREVLLKITQESSSNSLKWYETAATTGHPEGWLRLADLYGMASFFYKGYFPLSLSLYKKAIEQGNVEAIYRLGSLYSAGADV